MKLNQIWIKKRVKRILKIFSNSAIPTFQLPTLMKKLETPHTVFDLGSPSYKEITKIINNSKSSGSHDKISIIILKRCPILQTYIHKIISHCWTHRMFPRCWKYVFTILIHRKKSNTEPPNFRLQPVLTEMYSSLIRNRIYDFLIKNYFIETRIQKEFWKGISRTIEHVELLSHIINQARNKQRQIIITL